MSEKGAIQRKSYAKIRPAIDIPNLLDIQLQSYRSFLQDDRLPSERKSQGLQQVFQNIFPITDIHGRYSLEFVSYSIGKPKYTEEECRARDATYAAPLRATLRLVVRDTEDKERIRDIVEQTVFLGELPLMTARGTFIINGSERVIVSQLHRSPGVFFDETMHPNGKRLLSARVIAYHGTWLEFSMDVNDVMYIHIERKRKLPVTVFLRALGLSHDEHITALFWAEREVVPVSPDAVGQISVQEVLHPESGETLVDWEEELTEESIGALTDAGVSEISVFALDAEPVADELIGRVTVRDLVDLSTGEVLLDRFRAVGEEELDALRAAEIKEIEVAVIPSDRGNDVVQNTLEKDSSADEEEALNRIYSLLRPGDPPNMETAQRLVQGLYFNPRRYNLGDVGRYRLNQRLDLDVPMSSTALHKRDIVSIIEYLLDLHSGKGYTDDIDHLGNRRVRSVGELLGMQFSTGLSRMARTIRERMSLRDAESLIPHELVNARTVSTVIQAFFGSSQLSQFMQQVNPLDELTHKRRLSALGPGGLTRDRAGFDVRDVHHTHYGRICPIETPEGPNIGLIASLATYARVNDFGFLETPYHVVEDFRVKDRIEYLSADQEDKYTIAQANEPLDEEGRFTNPLVQVRRRGDYLAVPPDEVDYMDVSPMQLVSAAAALIPFLEHDDANRALMGSNMQRQAVPLLRPEPPLVGTGMEHRIALDSGGMIQARSSGVITEVSADRIVVQKDDTEEDPYSLTSSAHDVYPLIKFKRSNQDCCINQKPIVYLGDRVEKGQVLADGTATRQGDLALGANVLVAFMPWNGCNFEDAVVISEGLLKRDVFTSVHIEEFELEVRDTKRGQEEITRELPNVSEQAVRNLDEEGIIRVGAEVGPGDILVGKVTPKGETELSPEERLLRAIFGEKAGDVRDASLRTPPGMDGVAIDRMVFSRKERDEKARRNERDRIAELRTEAEDEIGRIRAARDKRFEEVVKGERSGLLRNMEDNTISVEAGHVLDEETLRAIDLDAVPPEEQWTEDTALHEKIDRLVRAAEEEIEAHEERLNQEVERISRGDELPPGIVQLVKIHIARKRRLSVGDKMAGRHGNKGVVATIVPEEDMPYLPDGTPVDIILNPLGVPSRMNLGQVFETHLGWAARVLGLHVATPVFSGATMDEVKEALREAELPETGKATLYDGQTGEPFDKEVAVGQIYMMKLSHLVSDKIHARSIGPYSLVTQQPLGGKAQFGGQRFGEMEVWALEAYGAAYTLQEMLTVKSDDVTGRSRIYEAIVKGENPPEPGIPESFNVLVKELQSLCLDVRLEDGDG